MHRLPTPEPVPAASCLACHAAGRPQHGPRLVGRRASDGHAITECAGCLSPSWRRQVALSDRRPGPASAPRPVAVYDL